MRDKQNPAVGSPVEDGQTRRGKSGETPKSYYYDDATGYEIYEDEPDTDEESEDPDEEGLC